MTAVLISGAKPFSCEICGRSFSQSGSRRVHMNRHKLDEAKKAADMVANGAEMEEVAAVDDSDFKSELSVKVDPPNDVLVLCNSSEDNVHYQGKFIRMANIIRVSLHEDSVPIMY